MSRTQRYSLTVWFCFVYTLAYFVTEFVRAPIWWYYPVAHQWFYGSTPAPGVMMGWYGKVLLCLEIALPLTGLAALGLRLSRRELPAEAQGLLDLATMATVVLTLFHLANSLAHRVL